MLTTRRQMSTAIERDDSLTRLCSSNTRRLPWPPVNLQLDSQTTCTLIFSDLYSFAWHFGWQHLLSHSLNFHGLAYLCILLEQMWVAYFNKRHFQPSSPPFKFQTS